MPDWIDRYVAETALVPSPECYRLWSAITAISGVMERRVWSRGRAGEIYPNLFTLLVGPPASGKTNAIRPIRSFWSKVQGLNIAPDNVTKAALIDSLSKALRTVINGSTNAYTFSSLVVPCSEFGVFFTHHDLEFLSVLNHIFDAPDYYREERRTSGVVEVNKPYLVILAGTQPEFLNSFLPDEAWGMGFTSRLIMIYADKAPATDIFSTEPVMSSSLANELARMFSIKGEFVWTEPAANEINAWNRAGAPPVPEHSKLLHYIGRRPLHAVKLAMISSVSRSPELIVRIDDVERAKDWLIQAEKTMPDIFRAMGQKSDSQVLLDMHFHLYRSWSSVALANREALHDKDLYDFLHTRVPSEKIQRLIDVAHKTGYIRQGRYPGEWIPNPLGNIGSM